MPYFSFFLIGLIIVSSLVPSVQAQSITSDSLLPLSSTSTSSSSFGSFADQRNLDRVFSQMSREKEKALERIAKTEAKGDKKDISYTKLEKEINAALATLKLRLQQILTNYSQQSPPAASQREANRVAQATLDEVRRRTDEFLGKIQERPSAQLGKLTDKYSTYDEKIENLVNQVIEKADQRLEQQGTQKLIRDHLVLLVNDTKKKMDAAAKAYVASNRGTHLTTLLSINEKHLKRLSDNMDERFRQANQLTGEKALKLTDDELRELEHIRSKMIALLKRTFASIEALSQPPNLGIAASLDPNLLTGQPSTTTVTGASGLGGLVKGESTTLAQLDAGSGSLDPLDSTIDGSLSPGGDQLDLVGNQSFATRNSEQAKEEIRKLVQTTEVRIDSITNEIKSRANTSALLREMVAAEGERQKDRLRGQVHEYLNYITALEQLDKKSGGGVAAAQCGLFGCLVDQLRDKLRAILFGEEPSGLATSASTELLAQLRLDSNLPGLSTNVPTVPVINGRAVVPDIYGSRPIPKQPATTTATTANPYTGYPYNQYIGSQTINPSAATANPTYTLNQGLNALSAIPEYQPMVQNVQPYLTSATSTTGQLPYEAVPKISQSLQPLYNNTQAPQSPGSQEWIVDFANRVCFAGMVHDSEDIRQFCEQFLANKQTTGTPTNQSTTNGTGSTTGTNGTAGTGANQYELVQ